MLTYAIPGSVPTRLPPILTIRARSAREHVWVREERVTVLISGGTWGHSKVEEVFALDH